MMTSTGRQEQDYRYLANQLKPCGIYHLSYGTDGALTPQMGFESTEFSSERIYSTTKEKYIATNKQFCFI